MKLLLAKTFLLTITGSLVTTVRGGRGSLFDGERHVCLKQVDFDNGTKIITEPGKYKLCENIVFHPNGPQMGQSPNEDAFVPDYNVYDSNAFGLGFFSAIAVAASGVEIDLNGKKIEQSEGHALFQRFFAIIELADSPFIQSVGPAQFVADGNTFQAASDVKIIGPGTIGRSSHHGIHGNENSNVLIKDVTFTDFEVAAVSLNNVDSLRIVNCLIEQNRQDVPVLGMFSAAHFIRPYAKQLADKKFKMKLRGEMTKASDAYDKLIAAVNNVYNDVVHTPEKRINKETHPDEYDLFDNQFRVVDGPSYAMVVHGKGPAVGGQGEELSADVDSTSSNIVIKQNVIKNIKGWTNEIPAVVEDGAVLNDARGAVFQFIKSFDGTGIAINSDGTYKGNIVADLQIMVAKAIQDGILTDQPLAQIGVNTINPTIVNWAMSGSTVYVPSYRCNGDSMHHVSKGMIIIRVEDTVGFNIEGNSIENVTNLSPPKFEDCTDYHAGASSENEAEQQAGNVRGISVAAVSGYVETTTDSQTRKHSSVSGHTDSTKYSQIRRNTVLNVASENANAIIGIDVQGESKSVEIQENKVDLNSSVGTDSGDEYIALRVREYADGSGDDRIKVRDNNSFAQEEVILNRRNLRSELKKIPGHPVVDGLEWELGGCPFAKAQGQVRK